MSMVGLPSMHARVLCISCIRLCQIPCTGQREAKPASTCIAVYLLDCMGPDIWESQESGIPGAHGAAAGQERI